MHMSERHRLNTLKNVLLIWRYTLPINGEVLSRVWTSRAENCTLALLSSCYTRYIVAPACPFKKDDVSPFS
jgi:hypothetical protein